MRTRHFFFSALVTAIAVSSLAHAGKRDTSSRSGKQSSAQSSCQSCDVGCDSCGIGSGYLPEAIDVDSLTIQAQSKRLFEASHAQLKFELPEDAVIVLSGQQMTTPGEKREFIIPVNDQKTVYKYEVRIEVVRGGKRYFKKQTLKTIRAGAILKIAVVAPNVPDGEPATIELAVEPEAVGGAEKTDTDEDAETKADAKPADETSETSGV